MADKAILIDTSKCIGCKGCQIACKQWNELAAGESEFFASTDGYENPSDLSSHTYNLIKFHSSEKPNGDPDWLFRKKQCMHCTDAECLNNCPTSTIKRSEDGFIFIDREGCIGCGTCVNVCPFSIPKLSDGTTEGDGGITKSYKCWACQDRVTNGQEPACVHTCAPDAAVYGDREELLTQARQRKAVLEAKGKTVYIYGENEKGGLHYLYILLGDPTEVYGLPSSADLNSSSRRAYIRKLRDQGRRYAQRILGKAIAV